MILGKLEFLTFIYCEKNKSVLTGKFYIRDYG